MTHFYRIPEPPQKSSLWGWPETVVAICMVALMFGAGFTFAKLGKEEKACEHKGGVIVRSWDRGPVCIKREDIL